MADVLVQEFERIKRDHCRALRATAARSTLVASVTRVFNPGTKRELLPILSQLEVDHLREMDSQADYREWFERNLSLVAQLVHELNADNPRVTPGYKWGHSGKILCIYACQIVLNTRYFRDEDADRIGCWLYLPIDGIVMNMLAWLGINLPFNKIREIDTPEKFYYVQDLVGEVASKVGVPRIWFDDVWGGDRQFGRQLKLEDLSK